jgi:hypothetical protein
LTTKFKAVGPETSCKIPVTNTDAAEAEAFPVTEMTAEELITGAFRIA